MKEEEKDGSFLEQMSPELHFNSLGTLLKSLGAEQGNATPQPLWDMRDKSEQLLSPQQLSYPKILGGHFQEKYNQLFWGLPSLHSESLVATAWISQGPAALQSPFFFFNGIANICPVPVQDKMSPLLSHTDALTYLKPQSSPLMLPIPPFQPLPLDQLQSQAHLQSCLPVLLPSLPSAVDSGASCPSSPNKPRSVICTEIQHPKRPLLGKGLDSRWILPSMVQRPQEVYNSFTLNPSQEHWAGSILPENFPISPELRGQLEQHIQKWLIQHRWDLPRKIQECLELRQLREELTRTRVCQANGKPGHPWPCPSSRESCKDVQKVRFQLGRESSRNLGHILGKVPKDPSRPLERSPGMPRRANSARLERNGRRPLKGDLVNDLRRSTDKTLESFLKTHLRLKSEQIQEDLIPLNVRRSWLAIYRGLSMSNSCLQRRNPAASKSWKSCLSTSQTLSFLNPCVQQALEAHITKFWVRHRWGLPLKVLKPINLFKLNKAQPCPLLPCARASSTGKVARFLGKPPCAGQRAMTVNESVCLVSSPSGKKMNGSQTGFPGDPRPSEAPLMAQASRQLSQTLTYSYTGRSQSWSVLGTGRGSLEVPLLPTSSIPQDPHEPCLQTEVLDEFQHRVEVEAVEQPHACAPNMLLRDCSTNMLLAAESLSTQGSQSKVWGPPYRGSDNRTWSAGRHEERPKEPRASKFTQVKETEDTPKCRSHQLLPKHKQEPPESHFQGVMRRFLQRIFPKTTTKEQKEPPRRGKPTSASAQSQKQGEATAHVDSNVAEAQELMETVGQMLEKKMVLYHKLCASKENQHREDLRAPVSQSFCYHRPPLSSEERRIPSYTAVTNCQRHPTQESHMVNQRSLKNVQFNKVQCGPQYARLLPPNKAMSTGSPSQHQPTVPRTSSHQHHCPRHCHLRGSVSSNKPENSSPVFPNRKTCVQEKNSSM